MGHEASKDSKKCGVLIPSRSLEDTHTRWYSVTATYKAVHLGVTRKRHLWERTVFLVSASGDAEALKIGNKLALESEVEYQAARGDTVRWVFQEIEDVKEIPDTTLREGTQVYWQFFERVDGTGHGKGHRKP
jgi:hypothetical protein